MLLSGLPAEAADTFIGKTRLDIFTGACSTGWRRSYDLRAILAKPRDRSVALSALALGVLKIVARGVSSGQGLADVCYLQ